MEVSADKVNKLLDEIDRLEAEVKYLKSRLEHYKQIWKLDKRK